MFASSWSPPQSRCHRESSLAGGVFPCPSGLSCFTIFSWAPKCLDLKDFPWTRIFVFLPLSSLFFLPSFLKVIRHRHVTSDITASGYKSPDLSGTAAAGGQNRALCLGTYDYWNAASILLTPFTWLFMVNFLCSHRLPSHYSGQENPFYGPSGPMSRRCFLKPP